MVERVTPKNSESSVIPLNTAVSNHTEVSYVNALMSRPKIINSELSIEPITDANNTNEPTSSNNNVHVNVIMSRPMLQDSETSIGNSSGDTNPEMTIDRAIHYAMGTGHHNRANRFKCPLCNYSFVTESNYLQNFERHFEQEHPQFPGGILHRRNRSHNVRSR